jgi:hypothetical protein
MLSKRITTVSRHGWTRSLYASSVNRSRVGGRAAAENPLQLAFKTGDDEDEDRKRYNAQNVDIPNVEALPKRWNKMDALDQEDIMLYLEDKMRGNWKDLTISEKKASMY